MKVTFIYPDIRVHDKAYEGNKGAFYHGVAYLSAVLKQAGHQTSLIQITKPINEGHIIERLFKEAPQLVAFSSTTHMFPFVREWSAQIKRIFKVPIICGGVHATIDPEGVIDTEGIDMVCIGEGEEALVELCYKLERAGDITDIKGCWVKIDGKICKSPTRRLIENLDTLPFPDRAIFDYRNLYDMKTHKRGVIMASRGCPYSCPYCCNHAMRNVYENKDKYLRFKGVDYLLKEIKLLLEDYPEIRYILINDDTFTCKKNWLREFAKRYKNEIGMPFTCLTNIMALDEEIIMMLKDAGCVQVSMGVESGNDYIRKEVCHRNVNRSRIVSFFSLCKRERIRIISLNMIGLPFENIERLLDTIKLNAEMKPDLTQVTVFYPYPGTDLYRLCKENGMLTEEEFVNYFETSILKQDSLSREEVHFFIKNFEALLKVYSIFFKFPKQISKLCIKILDLILIRKLIPYNLLSSTLKLINLHYSRTRLERWLIPTE